MILLLFLFCISIKMDREIKDNIIFINKDSESIQNENNSNNEQKLSSTETNNKAKKRN